MALTFPRGNPEALESGQSAELTVTAKRAKQTTPTLLDNYRAVTYNFTLAALDKEDIKNYTYASSNDKLKYIILKSGGKGSYQISTQQSLSSSQLGLIKTPEYDQRDVANNEKKAANALAFNQQLISEYNKNYSSDYYIDNVEINGIGAFQPHLGASLGTTITFNIFEPYGVNGFLEALHVASVAAGYPTYTFGAAFLLKTEFIGYHKDTPVEESKPERVEGSTRYFPFTFTKVEVEITPEGTRYSCSGVSYGDQGFGNPNVLKAPISMSGSTVKEVLTDLISNIQTQLQRESSEQLKDDKFSDKYEIKFPVRNDDGTLDFDSENKIASAKISFLNKARHIYAMPDPGDNVNLTGKKDAQDPKTEKEYRYNPTSKVQVQFNEGRNIHDCISGVIVDSDYVRNIYKLTKQPDDFVDYFIIQIFVEPLDFINPLTKINYKKYIYVVTPYKIHFSKIPLFQTTFDSTKLIKNYIWKRYNYIYTGKNINVINFKIDFNNLFFEAIPYALANSNYMSDQNNTAQEDAPGIIRKTDKTDIEVKNVLQGHGVNRPESSLTTPTALKTISGNSINYGDPYQVLSKNLHEAVINATVSGATGTLEILGDPDFLSSRANNYSNVKTNGIHPNRLNDGSIDFTYGEFFIEINFQVPQKINKTEDGGLMDLKKVPFSGVYKVTNIKSIFSEGFFKQILNVIRMPGQIESKDTSTGSTVATKEQPLPILEIIEAMSRTA